MVPPSPVIIWIAPPTVEPEEPFTMTPPPCTEVDAPPDNCTSAPAEDVEDPALNTKLPGDADDEPVVRVREPDVPPLPAPVEI